MNRFGLFPSLIVLVLALSGFAMVMLAGGSEALLLLGIILLLLGGVGGMFLGLRAIWRSLHEPTTLVREDGPPLLSAKESRGAWRSVALYSLLGAILTPILVVSSIDDPQFSLPGKIVGGMLLGASGPLVRYLPSW